ncbi:MAG: hypothetical protein RLQ12_12195 [Cyclobacteriaceae bacterium]
MQGQEAPKVKLFEHGFVSSSFIDGRLQIQTENLDAVYFDKNWHKGNVEMKDGNTRSGVYLRYDLIRSEVNIIENESIIAYPTRLIKRFGWYDYFIADSVKFISLFDQKSRYAVEEIYEVVVPGSPHILLKKTELEVQEPNYLPALDLGSPERKFVRHKNFFLYDGKRIVALDRKLANNLIAFNPYFREVFLFAKEHKLKCRKEEDLKTIVKHLNNLVLKRPVEHPETLTNSDTRTSRICNSLF